MWGLYPALINGSQGAIVQGIAFEVKSQQVATRLVEYETDACDEQDCIMQFKDGGKMLGVTFMWSYDVDDENLGEGTFNLQEWLED